MPGYLWTRNYSYYYFSKYIVLYLSSHNRVFVCGWPLKNQLSSPLSILILRECTLLGSAFTFLYCCRPWMPHFSNTMTLTGSRDLPMRFLCTEECQIENNDLIFKNNPFVSMISVSDFIIAIVVIAIVPSNLSLLSPGFLTSMFMHIIYRQLSAFRLCCYIIRCRGCSKNNDVDLVKCCTSLGELLMHVYSKWIAVRVPYETYRMLGYLSICVPATWFIFWRRMVARGTQISQ